MAFWLAKSLCAVGIHQKTWGGAIHLLGLKRNIEACARWHNHGVPCSHQKLLGPFVEMSK